MRAAAEPSAAEGPVGQPARWRNVALYALVVLVLGNLAGWHFAAAQGLGGLVFILTPLLTALGLRALAGDGWADAGLAPGLGRAPAAWALALGLWPLAIGAALGLGLATGALTLGPGGLPAWLGAAVRTLPMVALWALAEEFGWRGYLDARLARLGLGLPARVLLVALVWGLWHLGYFHANPAAAPTSPWLTPLAFVLMAALYAGLRVASGSIWPAVTAHALGNALAWPALDATILPGGAPAAFAARPEGWVVLAVLAAAAALTLTRARPGFTKR